MENPEDYRAFELSVTADIDAQTAVDREPVLRLASVLAAPPPIETRLLQIQCIRDLCKYGAACYTASLLKSDAPHAELASTIYPQ